VGIERGLDASRDILLQLENSPIEDTPVNPLPMNQRSIEERRADHATRQKASRRRLKAAYDLAHPIIDAIEFGPLP
jgi:hypothetical protein